MKTRNPIRGEQGIAFPMALIVMAILSALILGLFDFVWSNLTELVYG